MNVFYYYLLLILISANLNAAGFEGCGEYLIKGKLIESEKTKYKVIFVVNEKTRSRMNFELSEHLDFEKLGNFLNRPTTFIGAIIYPMNGTSGVVQDLKEIKLRYPNPLLGFKDEGLEKLKTLRCKN